MPPRAYVVGANVVALVAPLDPNRPFLIGHVEVPVCLPGRDDVSHSTMYLPGRDDVSRCKDLGASQHCESLVFYTRLLRETLSKPECKDLGASQHCESLVFYTRVLRETSSKPEVRTSARHNTASHVCSLVVQ